MKTQPERRIKHPDWYRRAAWVLVLVALIVLVLCLAYGPGRIANAQQAIGQRVVMAELARQPQEVGA